MRNPLGLALSNALMLGDQPTNPNQAMLPRMTPGEGMSTAGPAPDQFTPTSPMPPASKPLSRGELYAGILTDAISGAMGRPGQFAAMQGQRRQHDQEIADWGMRRQADLQDYGAKQAIEARYRPPPAPHYFEANNGDQYSIGADGKPMRVFQDPTAKMNFIPDGQGGGQWVAVPGSGGPMPTPSAAPRPVGRLTPIPGGAAPGAGTPFPPSFPPRAR